jgi:hypothetical protein
MATNLNFTNAINLDKVKINTFLAITANNKEIPNNYALISNGKGIAEWRNLIEYVNQIPTDQITDISNRVTDEINRLLLHPYFNASGGFNGDFRVSDYDLNTFICTNDTSGITMYNYKNNTVIPCINPIIGTVNDIQYVSTTRQYICVGADDTGACIKYSNDGLEWINVDGHSFNDIKSPQAIENGNNKLIVLGFDPDGTAHMQMINENLTGSWITIDVPIGFEFGNDIRYNGLIWLAAGGNIDSVSHQSFIYSYDGLIWQTDISGGFNGIGNSIDWNGNLWVAGGYDDTETGKTIKYSMNGIEWFDCNGMLFNKLCKSVKWNGNMWVAGGSNIGSNLTFAYSTDGITWTQVEGPDDYVRSVYWTGEEWLGVGLDAVYNSKNGIDWYNSNISIKDSELDISSQIVYIGGKSRLNILHVDSYNNRVGISTQFPQFHFDVNGDTRVNGNMYINSGFVSNKYQLNHSTPSNYIIGTDICILTGDTDETFLSIPNTAYIVIIKSTGGKPVHLPNIINNKTYGFFIQNDTSGDVILIDPNGLQTIQTYTTRTNTYTLSPHIITKIISAMQSDENGFTLNPSYIYYNFPENQTNDLSEYLLTSTFNSYVSDMSNILLDMSNNIANMSDIISTVDISAQFINVTNLSGQNISINGSFDVSGSATINTLRIDDGLLETFKYTRTGEPVIDTSYTYLRTNKTYVYDRSYLFDLNNKAYIAADAKTILVQSPVGDGAKFYLPNPITNLNMSEEITIVNLDISLQHPNDYIVVYAANEQDVILVEASNTNNRRVSSVKIPFYSTYTFRLIRNYKEGVVGNPSYFWICK